MTNPYESEKRQCILCYRKIEVDYKNPRLLSQFLSSFTGKVYERNITGNNFHHKLPPCRLKIIPTDFSRSMQEAAEDSRNRNQKIARSRISGFHAEKTRVHQRSSHLRCQQTRQTTQILILFTKF